MAENVKLADFNIDVSSVVKNITALRKEIDRLKATQNDAKEANNELTDEYTANEAILKSLSGELRKNRKALDEVLTSKGANAKATQEAADREQLMTITLQHEATTIEGLRSQNKLLNTLRNQTNLTTAEGRAELELLNAQLNRNNDLIKENVDELSAQKINVGNYTDSINEALGAMNPMNQSLGDFANNVDEAGGASAFFGQQLGALQQGIVGVTRASLAFIATPVGIVLAAIAAVVGLVANAMNRSEEATNKMNKVFSVFSGTVNFVLKALQPLGEFLIDGIVKGFELAAAAAIQSSKLITGALRALGFDETADAVDDLVGSYASAVIEANKLAEAEAELEKSQRKSRLVQLEYQKTAESLRQVRDNENLSIRERIQANEELSMVLQQQQQEELKLAQAALAVANLRIQQEGETKEALDAQYAALTEIADIEERVNSQRSEQLTNRMSLQKEATDLALQQQKDELDLFLAQAGERARTMQEELTLEEAASEKRKEILKAELNAKKLTQDAYTAELIRIDQDLARRRAEISANNALQEIEANKRAIERRREDAQFLSAELALQRQNENNNVLAQEERLAEQRLENGLINQQEFDTAIRELKEANRIANQEIDKEREAVEREEALELRAIEFEQELARMQEENATMFELQKAQRDEQKSLALQDLEQQRTDGKLSEELYQARLGQIKAQYQQASNKAALENEETLADQRIDLAQGMFSAIAQVVDQNSSLGKALAISQALINTYQGITAGVALGWPAAIPAVAFAAATGFKAVKDIVSTKTPSADGGTVEAKGAESVPSGAGSSLSGELQGLNSNESNLSAVAASGNATVQGQIQRSADQSALAGNVAVAVREGARQGTQQGSEQGLTNLSDNKQIENLSSF